MYAPLDSVMPAIASHVFCNIMGFPDPMGAIESFPSMKGREFAVSFRFGVKGTGADSAYYMPGGMVAIIGSYLAGIVGFVYGLRQL